MVNLQANDRRERTREYLDRERIAETRYLLIDCCSFTHNQQSFYVPVVVRLCTGRRKITDFKKYRFSKYITSFILSKNTS